MRLDPQRVREDLEIATAEVAVKVPTRGPQLDSRGVCRCSIAPSCSSIPRAWGLSVDAVRFGVETAMAPTASPRLLAVLVVPQAASIQLVFPPLMTQLARGCFARPRSRRYPIQAGKTARAPRSSR